ncbi:MAG: hypothetical protein U0793_17230 [Gemmataceae bacterium]
MGMKRRKAFERLTSLARAIEEHLQKLRLGNRPDSVAHLRHEIRVWIATIERGMRHVGEKTGKEWEVRLAAWREQIEDEGDRSSEGD